ncbi:conserved hypothetical protein [Cenarchaeum symbiosum A]|uniref:DUF262 domain-containing protein n=1 Tax=Cenarchaeum symbiosum (strain A) TaxID=414004 RepID=A0RY10_CENSY|nr:conserved hypothetical protein [Cenarchaeum symbiosum A]
MKAEIQSFSDLFEGARQIKVPIYQRAYSWERDDCEQLWEDVLKIAGEPRANHFMGTIVCSREDGSSELIRRYTVVDGQQRLATVLLLVAAWCKKAVELGVDPSRCSEMEYVFIKNQFKEDTDKYKLVLARGDNNRFVMLMEGERPAAGDQGLIDKAYEFFEKKLGAKTADIDAVRRGILGLRMAFIELGDDKDMAQGIFESLNSKGKPLTQVDLVRNFVLMSFDSGEREMIYDTTWADIENELGSSERFNEFVIHYLVAMTQTPVKADRAYHDFMWHVKIGHAGGDMRRVLVEMRRYAGYYKRMLDGGFAGPRGGEIDSAVSGIKSLKSTTAYPLLLCLAECHYGEGNLGTEDLLEILGMLESYVCRRTVCNLHTNRRIRVFNKLAKCVKEVETGHLARIRGEFGEINKIESERFPDDDEFMEKMAIANIYESAPKLYILRRLEESRGSKVLGPNHTIEHVMPRSLTDWWREHLGEEHEEIHLRYLHRVGNLTLTAHNPLLGNGSLPEKRDHEHGYANSGLNLDELLADAREWRAGDIDRRGRVLARQAVSVWRYPDIERPKAVPQNGGREEPGVEDFLKGSARQGVPEVDAPRRELFHALIERIPAELEGVRFKQNATYAEFKLGGNRFCMIKAGNSKLLMIYHTKDGRFAKDRKSVISTIELSGKRKFASSTEGDFISWIETVEDAELAMGALRALYKDLAG